LAVQLPFSLSSRFETFVIDDQAGDCGVETGEGCIRDVVFETLWHLPKTRIIEGSSTGLQSRNLV